MPSLTLTTEYAGEYDILILGGGLAGLGAAYRLKDTNLKYLILEAQTKAGGRINGQRMKVNEFEFSDSINTGAQWLHGKQNFIYKIGEKYNLMHSEQSEEALGAYFLPDGSKIDEYFVKKIDFKVGQILEECEEFAEEENIKEYPESIESFLVDNFNKYVESLPKNEQDLARKLLDYHIRFHIIDNSTLSLKTVSAKDWGTYSFNGESCQAHFNFKNNFEDVITAILGEIDNQIIYNKVVDKICWGTNSLAPDAKVLVQCKDGSVYQANQVIVTFSLGVLKEQHQLFHPKLPETHESFIQKFGFGTINKIFIQFHEKWWKDLEGIQLVFDDELTGDSHWTRYISGFDILKPGAPNTLLGWIGGEGALEMEKLDDEEVISHCINLLKKFTKMPVPEPKAYFVTRWHSNPFTRGTYSYVSTNCDDSNLKPSSLTTFVTYENLKFQPDTSRRDDDSQPLVLMAGEACHDKYYSTAHGAFHSGYEQVEKLLEFYDKK